KEDLTYLSLQWNMLLKNSVQRLPNDWMNPIFDKIREKV
ncbi:MAG: peptidase, partial [Runella slithyformis]